MRAGLVLEGLSAKETAMPTSQNGNLVTRVPTEALSLSPLLTRNELNIISVTVRLVRELAECWGERYTKRQSDFERAWKRLESECPTVCAINESSKGEVERGKRTS